ncbi:hypothetical protein IWX48DRAFT_643562 [Phyllosticta citricarpa]
MPDHGDACLPACLPACLWASASIRFAPLHCATRRHRTRPESRCAAHDIPPFNHPENGGCQRQKPENRVWKVINIPAVNSPRRRLAANVNPFLHHNTAHKVEDAQSRRPTNKLTELLLNFSIAVEPIQTSCSATTQQKVVGSYGRRPTNGARQLGYKTRVPTADIRQEEETPSSNGAWELGNTHGTADSPTYLDRLRRC